MIQFIRLLLLISFVSSLSPQGLAADSAGILRKDLERVFSDRRFADAQWGVVVFSLDRSESLYERNSRRLFIPASNNKILTAAAALMKLGPDYSFKTYVYADGPILDGVLKGDLFIEGFGDSTSSSRMLSKDPFQTFRLWASNLKQKEIRALLGRIIGNAGSFEETVHGRGWAWDDLSEGYAAPVSALQFNENLISLQIAPGEKTGSFASITMEPLADYLQLENKVITVAPKGQTRIEINRSRSEDAAMIRGSIPLKNSPLSRSVAVQFPTRYYLSALKSIINAEGIDTSKCEIQETRDSRSSSSSLLWIHSSPPFSEILIPMLKMSLNLVAETCVRTLGLEFRHEGSFSQGKEVVEDVLSSIGIQKESYSYADGSGLSRLNLVSADTLVQVLKAMHRHPHFEYFYSALPIAGVDGTLEFRMKGTKAENNVRAKTGTLASASSLAGYVRTADGEILAFAFIANNYIGSKDDAEHLQDRALIRLANFSRKAQNKEYPGKRMDRKTAKK